MFRHLILLPLWIALAAPAAGGAWLREERGGFVSVTNSLIEIDETGLFHSETALDLEYGLRPNLTIGASGNWVQDYGGEALAFLRWPLSRPGARRLAALELALGASSDGFEVYPFFKTGVSVGRDYTLGSRTGWMNLDAAILWKGSGGDDSLKLDGTVGLNLRPRLQVMGQAFFEADRNDHSLTLIPSVIWAAKKTRTRYVLGLEHRTGRRASTGLRLSWWRDF